jgi:hypothetical protein
LAVVVVVVVVVGVCCFHMSLKFRIRGLEDCNYDMGLKCKVKKETLDFTPKMLIS